MSAPSPEWEALWQEARNASILEVAQRFGVRLKKSGPDYTGPCPAGCASEDGFVVTPKKSIFLCRPSGATGDVVDMVVHAQGGSKAEALKFVTGRDPPAGCEERAEEREARQRQRQAQDAANEERRQREERAAEQKRRRDEEAVAGVVARAVPIWGTHAEAYLRARSIVPPRRLCGDLRFVADLDYWGFADGATDLKSHFVSLPAMVAVIRNVAGDVIGIHQTFLDPVEPIKWVAPHERTLAKKDRKNPSKKIRGDKGGGLIRLGMIGERLALGEGIETVLSWYALGAGPEDVSVATSVDLYNLSGSCTGTLPHPTSRGPDGKPARYPNGVPDPTKPGCILPECVREVIIIGDGDSEPLMTRGRVLAAGRRFKDQGRLVSLHMAPDGADFNDLLLARTLELETAP